jgi:hypothetical protein
MHGRRRNTLDLSSELIYMNSATILLIIFSNLLVGVGVGLALFIRFDAEKRKLLLKIKQSSQQSKRYSEQQTESVRGLLQKQLDRQQSNLKEMQEFLTAGKKPNFLGNKASVSAMRSNAEDRVIKEINQPTAIVG